MTLSTSTVTLAPGSSRTYTLAPGEAVTVATEPNCYVTVTETPDVITTADQGGQTNVRTSILEYDGEWTYGPYALGGTVVVAVSLAKSTSSVAVTLGSAAAAVVGAAAILQRGSLLWCLPSRDASVQFTDVSGNAAHGVIEAANVTAFNTADYITTSLGTTGQLFGVEIPAAKFAWNPARQSLMMAFAMKMAAPESNVIILGVSGGALAGQTGFYMSHRTNSKLKIVPTVAGVIVNAQADSTLLFSDGTPKDRHCVVAFDAPTGLWSIYRDGVLSDTFVATPMTGANAYPDGNVTDEYRIGSQSGAPATTIVTATLTYGHQMYVMDGGLPANVGQLASILANSPRNPLPLLGA